MSNCQNQDYPQPNSSWDAQRMGPEPTPKGVLGVGMGGLLIGLIVGASAAGIAGVAGYLTHGQSATPAWLNEIPLHAAAGMGDDNFVVTTGMIDKSTGVEGVVLLDSLTGNLQFRVLSKRNGKFAAVFTRNVLQDFGTDQAKKPKFLLATGLVDFVAAGGAGRPADSVVYVVDANSGNYAAYGIRWSPEMFNNGEAQVVPMILLDVGQARANVVRQ